MKNDCRIRSFWLVLLCAVVVAPQVCAQNALPSVPAPKSTSSSGDGWHVDITPYIWFSGVHGAAGVGGHEVGVHASFGEVVDYLNLGFMGAVEPRYNRFLFPMDFMWIKLTDKKAFDFDSGQTTGKVEFKQTVFTPGFGYRLVEKDKVAVDARVGLRYWHLNSSLKVQGPVVNNGISGTNDWVDVIGGGQISLALTPKVFVAVAGDAGGGGANSDYEVIGLFGARIARKWVLKAGYRYLDVNYRPSSSFVYNVAQSGLIVGATWNVK